MKRDKLFRLSLAILFLWTSFTLAAPAAMAASSTAAWCTALAGRVLVLAAAWPLLEEIGQKIGSIAG